MSKWFKKNRSRIIDLAIIAVVFIIIYAIYREDTAGIIVLSTIIGCYIHMCWED